MQFPQIPLPFLQEELISAPSYEHEPQGVLEEVVAERRHELESDFQISTVEGLRPRSQMYDFDLQEFDREPVLVNCYIKLFNCPVRITLREQDDIAELATRYFFSFTRNPMSP